MSGRNLEESARRKLFEGPHRRDPPMAWRPLGVIEEPALHRIPSLRRSRTLLSGERSRSRVGIPTRQLGSTRPWVHGLGFRAADPAASSGDSPQNRPRRDQVRKPAKGTRDCIVLPCLGPPKVPDPMAYQGPARLPWRSGLNPLRVRSAPGSAHGHCRWNIDGLYQARIFPAAPSRIAPFVGITRRRAGEDTPPFHSMTCVAKTSSKSTQDLSRNSVITCLAGFGSRESVIEPHWPVLMGGVDPRLASPGGNWNPPALGFRVHLGSRRPPANCLPPSARPRRPSLLSR
jgi:hypothetical protein